MNPNIKEMHSVQSTIPLIINITAENMLDMFAAIRHIAEAEIKLFP